MSAPQHGPGGSVPASHVDDGATPTSTNGRPERPERPGREGKTLLALRDVHAAYGQVHVLHGISFEVKEGEAVVILGANGAGKTTTLRSIVGAVGVRSGEVELDGTQVAGKRASEVARLGVAHVPQGRGTFADLDVEDNLKLGAFTRKDGKETREDIERWLEIFPRLGDRRKQTAGSLSGGEQQMLAIARALMSKPRLLLLDEPSLGLAPLIVQDLFERLAGIRDETRTTMLVVEQNANLALDLADRGYVLEAGQIAAQGEAQQLREDEAVRKAYLGY